MPSSAHAGPGPDPEHLARLAEGVAAWNRWRAEVPDVQPRLGGAQLDGASLAGIDLRRADLLDTVLCRADLAGADLRGASLQMAGLVNVRLRHADLAGSRVFGVAAWHLDSVGARQQDLRITADEPGEPVVACDDLETAQFVYLLLHNEKLRQVIDTVGRKAVLLLGRFTAERKAVLDALREALRGHGLVPMLFDFDKPGGRDVTETMSTLAHLARFVIADLTDPRSIPQALKAVVPALPSVPMVPLLHASQDAYAMFADLGGYASVLPPVRYRDLPHLLSMLADEVIAPAERRITEIQARRAAFEAALARG